MNYKIVYEKHFFDDMKTILNFIKKDKPQSAYEFKKELKNKIENLTLFPYKYRKSIYFNDDSIRDLIFKGYIIPYKITKSEIIILGITKYKPF
ncbi:plasmid stabilization protein [Nautilia sp. PV-1]|jgi:plasmid stabilization system protein ParE|uniref:type II toxin-antitoxin system RelE/ParE family toxin n=1 Tax=Nautilia sp. PV-1 TaxID=2579250 RepID=UPI000FDC95EE|nr:type II toxin-antitoxin system RelE/ParE family toxin [Nautilia sp. PV-1]AZV45893.1 plasmid stabilization protein [Nautilia sp. PV-1]